MTDCSLPTGCGPNDRTESRVANSLEKIEAFANEMQSAPGDGADTLDLAMRSLAMMAWPQFKQLLPDDPELLDEGLEAIAERILELRSDGARRLVLAEPVIEGDAVEAPAELGAGD